MTDTRSPVRPFSFDASATVSLYIQIANSPRRASACWSRPRRAPSTRAVSSPRWSCWRWWHWLQIFCWRHSRSACSNGGRRPC